MQNLTPHPITVQRPDGLRITFTPSGKVARVSVTEEVIGYVDGIPVIVRRFGEVVGLPPEGQPCIVSSLVLLAVPGRKEVYAPDTGPTAIRDGNGQIVAVTRLVAA